MRCIKLLVLSLVVAVSSPCILHAGLAVRLFYPGHNGNSVSSFKWWVPDFYYGFDPAPYFSLNGEDPAATFYTNTFDSGIQFLGVSYGSFFHGYIDPPQSGNYFFYIAGANDANMFLSTDHTTNNLRILPICENIGAGGYLNFLAKPAQKSRPIPLIAGKRYYYEVNCGAVVSVGWQLPDGTVERPMSAIYLQPFEEDFVNGTSRADALAYTSPAFATQAMNGGNLPGTASIVENTSANLSVAVRGRQPMFYQWFRNNVPLPAATNSFLSITNAKTLTNGSFRVTVTNSFGSLYSTNTLVTVTPDTVKPFVVSASVFGRSNAVTVQFSEPVANNATNPANYFIVATNGATLASVIGADWVVLGDRRRVNLLTTPLDRDFAEYYLTVSNVTDQAAIGNSVSNNSINLTIIIQDNLINYARFDGITNTDIGSLTNSQAFTAWRAGTGAATIQQKIAVTTLDTTGNRGGNVDNYGAIMWGYLVPPSTGAYRFYLGSDDQGALYLSTDSAPANKVMIAQVTSWGNYLQWLSNLGGGVINPGATGANGFTNFFDYPTGVHTWWSKPINLQADHPYYFEALQKEGLGGDSFGFTWEWTGAAGANDIVQVANGSPGISAAYLSSVSAPSGIAVSIADAALPADATVAEPQAVSFTVQADGAAQIGYQWFRSNTTVAAFLPIGDSQSATYAMPFVTFGADDQSYFYCVVSNGFSCVTSRVAKLTVTPDLVAPNLVKASGTPFLTNAIVSFSKAMDVATLNVNNFSIVDDNGSTLPVLKTVPSPTLTNVTLSTAPQTPGMRYTVTVSTNASDASSSSNRLTTAASVQFTAFVLTRGFLLREFYLNIGSDTNLDSLRSAASYPDSPNTFDYLPAGFNSPQTIPDLNNFGARISGVLTVPTNTALVPSQFFYFYLQSDEVGALYIGPDATIAGFANSPQSTNPVLFATAANGPTNGWYGSPLVRGSSYFIQGLYKDASLFDYMRVAWRDQADGNTIRGTNANPGNDIPATYLSAYADPTVAAVTITGQPIDSPTIIEGSKATFVVTANGTNLNNATPPISYIWQTAPPANPGAFADIDGQGVNANSYTTPPLFAGDVNRRYRCIVSVPGASAISAFAVITNITAVTNPLVVVSAIGSDNGLLQGNTLTSFGLNDPTNVTVSFDRLIDPTSVIPSRFQVTLTNGTGALSVYGATVQNGTNIVLSTSQQTEGARYVVTVLPGITDQNASHNTVSTVGNTQTFTGWVFVTGAVTLKRYLGIYYNGINSLRNAPNFPDRPDFTQFLANWETNGSVPGIHNFGDWSYGYFIPPTNGVYVFAESGSDNCELWLSTDATPAHKILIATESVWNGFRDWRTNARRSTVNNHLENQSSPITMVAGQRYYMEYLHKAGSGGDWSGVAVGNKTNFSTIFIDQSISPLGYAAFTNNNGPSTTVPGGTIPGAFMGLYANPDASVITVTAQPVDTTNTENRITTFSVSATAQNYFTINAGAGNTAPSFTAPIIWTWQRNGTNIPGASNAPSFSFTNTMANSNDTYQVVMAMTNVFPVTNVSSAARLTVVPDRTPPLLLSVKAQTYPTNIMVTFDEAISAATASNPAHFTLSSGAGPLAVLSSTLYTPNKVLLTTAFPAEGTNYTLSVSGIQDVAAAGGNTIVATQKVFSSLLLVNGLIRIERFEGLSGAAISNFTNSAAYKANDPTLRDATESGILYTNKAYIVQSAPINLDNFGARMIGYFRPPTNGVYTFFNRGDDGTAIYLTFNGVRTLASGRDAAANQSAQSSNPPNNPGGTVPQVQFTLLGGNYYPIEMLLKDGGGGDVFEGYVTAGSNTNAPGQTGQPATGAGSTIPGSMLASYANPDDTTLAITVQPASQGAAVGQTRTFSVTQTNDSKLIQAGAAVSYQWYTNGVAITAATNSSYTTPALALVNDGDVYTVVVILPEKSLLSAGATMTVVSSGPAITLQPQPAGIVTNVGANVSYIVAATGPALSYQWFFNVSNTIASATAATLSLNNVQKTNAGSYTVRVSNPGGSVTSSPPATLSVLVTPYAFTNVALISPSNFTVSFPTDAGRTYKVEFATTLSTIPPTTWTTLTNIVGTGGTVLVNDAPATGTQRYYRISTSYP